MEKQWELDEKNPEFPILRRAWRRNIRDLWSQICAKLQSKAGFHALFASETGETGETGEPGDPGDPGDPGGFGGGGSDPADPSTVVNVEFSMNGNMDHAFLYEKQPSSLNHVEEPALSMSEFITSEGAIEQSKDALGYVAMMDGESAGKRKSRSRAEVLPFPDDFRHYKYLPVFCHCWGRGVDHPHVSEAGRSGPVSPPDQHAQAAQDHRRVRAQQAFLLLRFHDFHCSW